MRHQNHKSAYYLSLQLFTIHINVFKRPMRILTSVVIVISVLVCITLRKSKVIQTHVRKIEGTIGKVINDYADILCMSHNHLPVSII